MKEISVLIKNLKGFPPNSFVYTQASTKNLKAGLIIMGYEHNAKTLTNLGFIETGDDVSTVITT